MRVRFTRHPDSTLSTFLVADSVLLANIANPNNLQTGGRLPPESVAGFTGIISCGHIAAEQGVAQPPAV